MGAGSGSRSRAVEDRRHLTGDANFVDDIRTAGVLHVAFARSPHGAARIEGIDTAEAERAHGVRAVLTAADPAPTEGGGLRIHWPPPGPAGPAWRPGGGGWSGLACGS